MEKSSGSPTPKTNTNDNCNRAPTVATLVVAARRTDTPLTARHRAYTELVVRFQDMAFGCAFALLGDYPSAEDAAQEAFLSAYQRLGQLRDAAAFPGWLQQIVRTQCHRNLRCRSVSVVPLVEGLQTESSSDSAADEGPEATALRRERREQIAAALAALPETKRLVAVLFYVREYSRAEVAEFLGISVVAVKKRLASARGRLKERLVEMVKDDLHAQRPSNDAIFATQLMAFTKLFCSFVDEGVRRLPTAEEDIAFRAAIDDINAEIQGGNCLSFATAKPPTYFSPEYIAAIRNGEVVGRLEVVLARLADGTYSPDCVKALTLPATAPTNLPSKTPGVEPVGNSAGSICFWGSCRSRCVARLDDKATRWSRERIDTLVLLTGLLEITHTPDASGFFEDAGIRLDGLLSAAADVAGEES